jgi:hypothetical protein
MDLGTLLSTILLVSFIVTIILAIGSYMAYKFRERRRPRESTRPDGAPVYFERVDVAALVDAGSAKRDER